MTTDPFIVYTSNIFAILGLRALYFLLANVIDKAGVVWASGLPWSPTRR